MTFHPQGSLSTMMMVGYINLCIDLLLICYRLNFFCRSVSKYYLLHQWYSGRTKRINLQCMCGMASWTIWNGWWLKIFSQPIAYMYCYFNSVCLTVTLVIGHERCYMLTEITHNQCWMVSVAMTVCAHPVLNGVVGDGDLV